MQASDHQWERVQSIAANPTHPDSYLAACLLELKANAVTMEQLLASPCRKSVAPSREGV